MPVRKNHFHEISIGEGMAGHLHDQASRHPRKKFAAIDPGYASTHPDFLRYADKLRKKGVTVLAEDAVPALRKLVKAGKTTDVLRIDMPGLPVAIKAKEYAMKWGFDEIFRAATKILPLRGKVAITSESREYLRAISEIAVDEGFVVKQLPNVVVPKTMYMRQAMKDGQQIHVIECYKN